MKFKCVVCGCDIEQRTTAPKIYCSDSCCYIQQSRKLHSKEWIEAEKKRRRQAYMDGLPDDERERIAAHRSKDKFYHYMSKPEELATRRCHDCGKPCVDYRCPECWAKLRRGNGLTENITESESIWDDF